MSGKHADHAATVDVWPLARQPRHNAAHPPMVVFDLRGAERATLAAEYRALEDIERGER